MHAEKMREHLIDALRGAAVGSMVLFHFCYDVFVILGRDPDWYGRRATVLWQQSICWCFILISGYVWRWGREKALCRGLLLNGFGLLISLVTYLALPEEAVWFGILSFLIKLNRDIFETIYGMFAYGQTIDPVTVLDQMRVRGVYQDNCESYIAELMRVTPTAANVLEYAEIVRDRALLRRLGEAADEINALVYEEAGEAEAKLEAAERKIYALRQGRTVGGLVPVSQVVQRVFEEMNEGPRHRGRCARCCEPRCRTAGRGTP